jgi:hypothetical protein
MLSIKSHCLLDAKEIDAYQPIDVVYKPVRNSLEGEWRMA